jgi:hypothetical protein
MSQSPTGRLSSKGPNIQNITPKTEEFKKIRAAFIGGEWFELGLKFAISPPDSNVEGRWIFAYIFESMNNRTFQFKSRSYVFYTLGMDGIE